MSTEFELINHAVHRMKAEGVGVTPGTVERAVNAATGKTTVSEVVAGVNRLAEQMGVREPLRDREVVGPKPAQQYAPVVPYWNEPRVSDSKRAELEAEAAGIKTQLKSPDLTPSQKIRLEQA